MRPGLGLDNNAGEPSRPRKSSNAESTPVTGDRDRCSNPATTFFLSRDPDGGSRHQPAERPSTSSSPDSPLSSLQSIIDEADRSPKQSRARTADGPARSSSRRRSTIKPGTAFLRRGSSSASASSSASPDVTKSTQPTLSDKEGRTGTCPSPLPSREVSLPSSPKSVASRQSHSKSSSASEDGLSTSADETGSQAILSSGEDDDNEAGGERNTGAERPHLLARDVQDSQPELIMPSIKMPSRRPFTQRGSRLGRFKIMVAGRKGRCFFIFFCVDWWLTGVSQRRGQDFPHQIHGPALRRYCPR